LIFIIVGIDPGIKTGYAILDLNGSYVAGGCEKEASDERMVREVSRFGVPVLIASDTHPPSSFVSKIAARLNVRVCSPKVSMLKEEKRVIGRHIDDPHTRDAYAAAVKAYRKHQNRLRQIDCMDLPIADKDSLKRMAITGHRIADKLPGGSKMSHKPPETTKQ
jgi:uncharacterized protein